VPPTPTPTVDQIAIINAQRQLNDSAISYNQAQNTYDDALAQQTSGLKQAQAQVDAAQAALDQLKSGPSSSEVDEAQSEVDQAQALVSDLESQPKKEDVDAAQADVNAAQADLSNLQKGGTDKDIALAQATYDRSQAVLKQLQQGPGTYEIAQAQTTLDQAQIGLRQAQNDLDSTVLRAPFNGIIGKLMITPDQSIRAQESAATLLDLSTLKVDALVSQGQVVRVNTKEQALVRFDSLPNAKALTGRVDYISTNASLTPGDSDPNNAVYTVSILLDNSASLNPVSLGVRPGMKSAVQIVTDYRADVLTIPANTVRRTSNGWVADTLMPNGNLVAVPINVGLVGSNNMVEVQYPTLLHVNDKLAVYPPAPVDTNEPPTPTPTVDVGALSRVRNAITTTPVELATVTPSSTKTGSPDLGNVPTLATSPVTDSVSVPITGTMVIGPTPYPTLALNLGTPVVVATPDAATPDLQRVTGTPAALATGVGGLPGVTFPASSSTPLPVSTTITTTSTP
jgi:multidrug resistance efflux pump